MSVSRPGVENNILLKKKSINFTLLIPKRWDEERAFFYLLALLLPHTMVKIGPGVLEKKILKYDAGFTCTKHDDGHNPIAIVA